jgi:hypothetical protein
MRPALHEKQNENDGPASIMRLGRATRSSGRGWRVGGAWATPTNSTQVSAHDLLRLQGQQADATPAGQPRGQRAHPHDRLREPERHRRRGDPEHLALRGSGPLHQEQARGQRGSQGRPPQAVPARAAAAAEAHRVQREPRAVGEAGARTRAPAPAPARARARARGGRGPPGRPPARGGINRKR